MTESATQAEAEEGALAAVSGQVKKLIARLVPVEGEDASDQTPLKVEFTARSNIPAYVSAVPYHLESEEEPLPTEADAYLQVWEMDRIRVTGWGANAEGDTHDERNLLVASIPGIVVREDAKFGFRSLGDPLPVRSAAPAKGSLKLELNDAEGQPQELEVWLPEHESLLELVCVLRSRVNDSSMEDATASSSGILQVWNLHGSARRQIEEEGGLTLAFVADYETSDARNDVKQRNDAEFARQAAGFLGTRASFVLKDGKLSLGYTLVKGSDEIASVCEEVRCAVANDLGLSEPPKVATLLLYGHGTRTRLQLNPAGYRACGSLQPESCEDLVTVLDPHLADEVTVALFACNNARGDRAGGRDPRRGLLGVEGLSEPDPGWESSSDGLGAYDLGAHHAQLSPAGDLELGRGGLREPPPRGAEPDLCGA